MALRFLLSLFALSTLSAQTGSLSIVSAASYQAAVAPNSLASIFGSGLATSTASAALDPSGHLPLELGGTTVEVNGETSPLIYVSPRQINFLVPDDATAGVADIVVRTAAGTSISGTVLINNTAPALFSLDASGKGPGAILNAATFTAPPFLVETSSNSGTDKRTRIAVYATGLRYAGNPTHDPSIENAPGVTVQAHDTSGNPYNLEYAGAAPGFFGLDQVNIVLPAEVDGAGAVSIFVDTDDGSSNAVTFQVNSLAVSAIHMTGLTLSTNFVTAGDNVQGTVSLNGRAPLGGITVSLGTSDLAAQVPPSVTIAQGKVSTQFTFSTGPVSTARTVTITAQARGSSQTAALEVDPANTIQLQSLAVNSGSIQGGHDLNLTATLNGPAAPGAVTIQLAADNAAVQLPQPAVLTIPFGQTSASIAIPTSVVSGPQSVTLTGTLSRSSQQTTVTVNPAFTLTLSSTSVTGGNSAGATLTLAEPPPSTGVALLLKSTDPVARVPESIGIGPGQTSAPVTINTTAVTTVHNVAIAVSSPISYPGVIQTATLTVTPPGSAQLKSVSLNQSIVAGGNQVTGVVTLTAPAPANGAIITLKSSDAHAQVPQIVSVMPGQTTAIFTVATAPVTSITTATITATFAGISQSAVLKIQ